MRRYFFLFFLAVSIQYSQAQTNPVWHKLRVGGDTVKLHLDDFAELNIPATTRFIKAVELEIQLPDEFVNSRVNLAVSIYQIDALSQDLPGNSSRIAWEVLPPERHFYVDIPLVRQADLKASVDTAVLKEPAQFPLAIAIRPLEKSTSLLPELDFKIRARWVDTNLGGLEILCPGLNPDLRKELKILVNGHRELTEGILFFPPGIYDVTLKLPGYKTKTWTTVVSSAKVTQLTSIMQEDPPRVAFEAPKGTQVYLDGKLVPPSAWKSLTTSKGIHTIQFVIGGYQVTDNFEITRGGLHKISLLLQIGFQEE
ncbi:MAG: hypothetical protein HKM06_09580 [Spirochaetales bacterium]|nr:hypothetical protein [Spirochaetales bacterium]